MYKLKITRKISLYLKYPNQLQADFFTILNHPRARRLGINFIPPNYLYKGEFSAAGIIIDVGCGFLADFSCSLIEKFGLTAYGVDPTLKHKEQLQVIVKKYAGKFHHIPAAVSTKNGSIIFHETLDNESGSILEGHKNILNDTIRKYEVESMNLPTLVNKLNVEQVDLIKLDLESAEFELLSNITHEDVKPFKQIYIEFHHLAVKDFSGSDMRRIVKKIKGFGYNSFTLDRVNYLFYR
jgi:FkbM family methyltransferase